MDWFIYDINLRYERVNDERGKVLNLLFFVYFSRKSAETFNELQFCMYWEKQYIYLTPVSPVILWKADM